MKDFYVFLFLESIPSKFHYTRQTKLGFALISAWMDNDKEIPPFQETKL